MCSAAFTVCVMSFLLPNDVHAFVQFDYIASDFVVSPSAHLSISISSCPYSISLLYPYVFMSVSSMYLCVSWIRLCVYMHILSSCHLPPFHA